MICYKDIELKTGFEDKCYINEKDIFKYNIKIFLYLFEFLRNRVFLLRTPFVFIILIFEG